MKQPPEVILLAKKLLKAAGKQSPVTLMNALLVCMELIDAAQHGPRKTKTPNAKVKGGRE